jgi:hypothetical protein
MLKKFTKLLKFLINQTETFKVFPPKNDLFLIPGNFKEAEEVFLQIQSDKIQVKS